MVMKTGREERVEHISFLQKSLQAVEYLLP